MSSTALIEFSENLADSYYEFRNAWGGAARIWGSLFEAYIEKKYEYDSWLMAANDGRLWEVVHDERLSRAERVVYLMTCDNALVKNENFKEMAKALREFAVKHPVDVAVCHLESWAKVFESSQAEVIGLYATSVVENPWFGWNEEKDEPEPYDISKGDKHWFVFDRLNEYSAA